MRTRTLGIIGILCSPFLALQLNMFGLYDKAEATSLGGVFSLIYMVGWFCSILGLYRLNAAGTKKGRTILQIQMVLLTIGNLWNIYSIIDPKCDTLFFHIVDLIGWPFDNFFMLVTGIAIASAKRLQGWMRYVPLFVGFWFPITIPLMFFVLGSSSTELFIISSYSIIGWSLLGLTVYLSAGKEERITSFSVRPALVEG